MIDTGAALESRRVAEARAYLRSGDARGALSLLDALRRDFPRGVLAQERDALAIEAMLALGDRAKARAAATRFLAQYPASPHAATVKRALE
jgi:outer membrane protein assembly factor BamD (BamD/ComL family)